VAKVNAITTSSALGASMNFLLSALASFYVTTNLDLQIDFHTAAMYRV
jgi:hypothetical protein